MQVNDTPRYYAIVVIRRGLWASDIKRISSQMWSVALSIEASDSITRHHIRGRTVLNTYLEDGITVDELERTQPGLYGALLRAMVTAGGRFVQLDAVTEPA